LGDWDFRAAMSDRRSRAPGPAYERLLAQLGPRIAAAKASGDPEAYEAVQREMWEAYAAACPAACPPRIGDARYRPAWVAWSAKSQALQDLDPAILPQAGDHRLLLDGHAPGLFDDDEHRGPLTLDSDGGLRQRKRRAGSLAHADAQHHAGPEPAIPARELRPGGQGAGALINAGV
jgi:hypothetical protein